MVSMMKRPDMKAYFRGRIDQHVNGMFARPVPRPSNVKSIVGDVKDSVIIVTMLDGTKYFWEGGKYASRKVNLCYAPLMPKPVDVPSKKYEDGHTWHGEDCMSEWGEARRYTLPLTKETIAANHVLHMHDVETVKRYEVRDQNGDVLDAFDSWASAVVRFADWSDVADKSPLAGAGIWDNEDGTWQARI